MTPASLTAWMHKHDLNKADLSRITGVARTTLDRYLAGAYPIPKLFELACRGIDSHVAQHGNYYDLF